MAGRARLPAQDGTGQRLRPERGFEQMVVDQVVGRIEAFAQLRQDDQLLPLKLGFVELLEDSAASADVAPSATMPPLPPMTPPGDFIASRRRCIMNHAVL